MIEVVVSLDFEVPIKNIKDQKIRDLQKILRKGYDKAHHPTPRKHPQHAFRQQQ
jgi:hypothetical protein